WWQGMQATLSGAIDEELLRRLCVMSCLAWLGRYVSKTPEGTPTTAVFWTANVLAAILFGLGHLPATSAMVPLTPLVVIRAVVLNSVIGIAAGYLYFTRGLESAMLSHFSADIILHVLFAI
ncbi:MAG: type II CAAX prenyl endopeptidase Rce1 family protein, partial [Anaerolineales bacterium]